MGGLPGWGSLVTEGEGIKMPMELKGKSTLSPWARHVSYKTQNFKSDGRWGWQWEVILEFGAFWKGGGRMFGWKSLGQRTQGCVCARAHACVHTHSWT